VKMDTLMPSPAIISVMTWSSMPKLVENTDWPRNLSESSRIPSTGVREDISLRSSPANCSFTSVCSFEIADNVYHFSGQMYDFKGVSANPDVRTAVS
jgi:hypothetical protein